jgi:hypothetical protein
MIDGENSLQTLAEVSVALAGFASLLVVLRRGSPTSVSEGEGADLFVVVGGNLLVLLFSLLPLSLHHLGVSDPSTWRISSVLLAVALLFGYVVVLRRRAQLLRTDIQPSFPRVSRIAVQTPLIVVALLVLNATGLFGGPDLGQYLLCLILFLALSSLPLVFVVIELAGNSRK